MNRFNYVSLVEGFCQHTGLSNADLVTQGNSITVDKVTFTLDYNEHLNPYSVYVYCDYGEVPSNFQNVVLEYILQENTFRMIKGLPVFALVPETNRVITMHHFPLAFITAEQLYEQLTFMAAAVQDWKKIDWYLVAKSQKLV